MERCVDPAVADLQAGLGTKRCIADGVGGSP